MARRDRFLPRLPPLSRAALRSRRGIRRRCSRSSSTSRGSAPDYWGVLPVDMRRAVHAGVLANDLVASTRSAGGCRSSTPPCDCSAPTRSGDDVELGGRTTQTVPARSRWTPREFDALATSDARARAAGGARRDRPERLIVRVDRTDPSKNILRGCARSSCCSSAIRSIAAASCCLRSSTRRARRSPSTRRTRRRSRRPRRRERAARPRGGRLRLADDFPLSVAAYKEYDVLFVNPILDGLNLVAKEGPLVNERDGVLVLSETAGAADELGAVGARRQPVRRRRQAAALHRALELPPSERRSRLEGIRGHVASHDVALG